MSFFNLIHLVNHSSSITRRFAHQKKGPGVAGERKRSKPPAKGKSKLLHSIKALEDILGSDDPFSMDEFETQSSDNTATATVGGTEEQLKNAVGSCESAGASARHTVDSGDGAYAVGTQPAANVYAHLSIYTSPTQELSLTQVGTLHGSQFTQDLVLPFQAAAAGLLNFEDRINRDDSLRICHSSTSTSSAAAAGAPHSQREGAGGAAGGDSMGNIPDPGRILNLRQQQLDAGPPSRKVDNSLGQIAATVSSTISVSLPVQSQSIELQAQTSKQTLKHATISAESEMSTSAAVQQSQSQQPTIHDKVPVAPLQKRSASSSTTNPAVTSVAATSSALAPATTGIAIASCSGSMPAANAKMQQPSANMVYGREGGGGRGGGVSGHHESQQRPTYDPLKTGTAPPATASYPKQKQQIQAMQASQQILSSQTSVDRSQQQLSATAAAAAVVGAQKGHISATDGSAAPIRTNNTGSGYPGASAGTSVHSNYDSLDSSSAQRPVQVQLPQPTQPATQQQQMANKLSMGSDIKSRTTGADTASSIYGAKSSVPVQQLQGYPGYGTTANQMQLPERNNQSQSTAPASSVSPIVPPSNSTLQTPAQSVYGVTVKPSAVSAPTVTSAQSAHVTAPQLHTANNSRNTVARTPAAVNINANRAPDSAPLASSVAIAKPSSQSHQLHIPGFDDDFDISDADLEAIDALAAAAAQKKVCALASEFYSNTLFINIVNAHAL